jgi:hypothetical protein
MLVHNVYFWLKENLSDEDRAKFLEGVKTLSTIESTTQVFIGEPAGTEPRPIIDRTYDCGLTVVLENITAHDEYQADPIHLEFVKDCGHLWDRVQIYDSE